MTTEEVPEKVREYRLRRAAARQGLRLERSRVRDPHAPIFRNYHLVDIASNSLVASGSPSGYGLTLDEVEDCLL